LYRLYRAGDFPELFQEFGQGERDTDDTKRLNRDIPAIRALPRVRPSDRGRAMTKTISIYAAQILLGVIAIGTGYAKLTGMGVMVHQFEALGFGTGFLMVAGLTEIVAGLCLLMPRGGILGALLLTCVMVGALGMTIGHVASAVAAPARAPSFTSTSYQALAGHAASAIQIVHPRTEWDI
jgi:uncharacterized membrane protein YphA (DoxX/SURF4 family)